MFTVENGRILGADLANAKITDPTPLAELPLETLNINNNPLTSLEFLRGMPLRELRCTRISPTHREGKNNPKVVSLEPLADAPQEALYATENMIVDLTPLRGMALEKRSVSQTDVGDLDVN